jgi:hypothetical protein
MLAFGSPLFAQGVLLKGEMNAVGFYSTRSGGTDFAAMTPRTSLGLEWGWKGEADDSRPVALDTADVLLRFIRDPVSRDVVLAPFDVWARFRVGSKNWLRVGHFQIPYGLNPVLAPRSMFLLPLGAYDLGFKWDWGSEYKGSLGRYDYEVAGTTGLGETLRAPDGSYLLAGRIGMPTYRTRQYGVSVLAGEVPPMMLNHLLMPAKVPRWRLGADATYMWRPFRVAMAEIAYGENSATPVGGVMVALDQILPSAPQYSVEAQAVSWFTDLSHRHSDNTLLTLAAAHTLANNVILRLAWVHNVHVAMGEPFMGRTGENRVFLQVYRTFDLPR